MIKVIGGLPHLESTGVLRKWLYRICINQALDLRRQSARRQKHEMIYAMSQEFSTFGTQKSKNDDRILLFQALQRIHDDQRNLIVEHYFEHTSLERIAIREGLSKTAIWKRLESARQSLRGTLTTMGMAAAAPNLFSYMEACSPVVLPTDLVAAAISKAALTSPLNITLMGGTAVASKSTFVGLASCIATLALLAGGTAGYLIRPTTALSSKVRELENRLMAANGKLERAHNEMREQRELSDSTLDRSKPRIAELESQVVNLQKALADSTKAREAQDQTQVGKVGDKDHPIALPGDFNLDKLCDLLGLDAGRTAGLKQRYEDVQARIRQIETEVATVHSHEEYVRIEIPALGARGEQLKEEWNQNLSYILTAAERERYLKHELGRNLFERGYGFGEAPRIIELTHEGKRGTVRETIERVVEGVLTTDSYSKGFDFFDDGASFFRNKYQHILR